MVKRNKFIAGFYPALQLAIETFFKSQRQILKQRLYETKKIRKLMDIFYFNSAIGCFLKGKKVEKVRVDIQISIPALAS